MVAECFSLAGQIFEGSAKRKRGAGDVLTGLPISGDVVLERHCFIMSFGCIDMF
jgi:hypothetical protein